MYFTARIVTIYGELIILLKTKKDMGKLLLAKLIN
jgi:hypothetical protein